MCHKGLLDGRQNDLNYGSDREILSGNIAHAHFLSGWDAGASNYSNVTGMLYFKHFGTNVNITKMCVNSSGKGMYSMCP